MTRIYDDRHLQLLLVVWQPLGTDEWSSTAALVVEPVPQLSLAQDGLTRWTSLTRCFFGKTSFKTKFSSGLTQCRQTTTTTTMTDVPESVLLLLLYLTLTCFYYLFVRTLMMMMNHIDDGLLRKLGKTMVENYGRI